MEAINEFVKLKGRLISIKDFVDNIIDKSECGLEGGYNLNKVIDNLTIAINRIECDFNIFSNSEDDNIELTIKAPYAVCVSDVLSELRYTIIPTTSNNSISAISFLIDNAKMWLFEESKRLIKLNS